MAKRNDFLTGFLQGLYNSGVGNPQVGAANAQADQDRKLKQAQLNIEAQKSGMVPAPQPAPSPMGKIGQFFKGAIFPGGQGPALQTAFVPDAKAPKYYQTPEGKTGFVSGQDPLPQGAVPVDREKGATMANEQYRKETPNKPPATLSFDSASALFGKNASSLIKDAVSKGKTELDANDIATLSKAASAQSQSDKAGYFSSKAAQIVFDSLPSNDPSSIGGQASGIQLSARQGQSLVASPDASPQRIALSVADLTRAVQRSAPNMDTTTAANFNNNVTRLNRLIQDWTADPNGTKIDVPKTRKEIYDILGDLQKSSRPFVERHLNNIEKQYPGQLGKDWKDTRKQELGDAIKDIPFDEGNVSHGTNAPPPNPGSIVKGYRFKGGDPSNRLNWMKVQ